MKNFFVKFFKNFFLRGRSFKFQNVQMANTQNVKPFGQRAYVTKFN